MFGSTPWLPAFGPDLRHRRMMNSSSRGPSSRPHREYALHGAASGRWGTEDRSTGRQQPSPSRGCSRPTSVRFGGGSVGRSEGRARRVVREVSAGHDYRGGEVMGVLGVEPPFDLDADPSAGTGVLDLDAHPADDDATSMDRGPVPDLGWEVLAPGRALRGRPCWCGAHGSLPSDLTIRHVPETRTSSTFGPEPAFSQMQGRSSVVDVKGLEPLTSRV